MANLNPTNYLRSVIEEGKKVIWPSRETIIRHSLMVVATVVVATLIVAGLDFGLQKLVVLALTKGQ